jgi:hypothetical protein
LMPFARARVRLVASALVTPPIMVLMAVSATFSSGLVPEDQLLIGELDGEVRLVAMSQVKGSKVCQLKVFNVPEGRIIAVTPFLDVHGIGRQRCSVGTLTGTGSAWLVGAEQKGLLIDLWSGEVVFDLSKEVEGSFRVESEQEEWVTIQVADGSRRTLGPNRESLPIRFGMFKDVGKFVDIASALGIEDPRHWEFPALKQLFRAQILTRDLACADLATHYSTAVGAGDLLISRVGPSGIGWTKSVSELVGKGTIRGAIDGNGSCFLVAEVGSRTAFYTLNPSTGETELLFSLR